MKKLAFACTLTSGAAAVAMLNHQDADASTQYTVQSGDSLWSIAQKYGTTVDALKQSNQLQNNMVFPGQVLSIGAVVVHNLLRQYRNKLEAHTLYKLANL